MDPEAMRENSKSKHPLLLAVAGGLAGGAMAIIAQYAVTYRFIEAPKLELEAKKVDIEIYKLGAALLPIVDASCTSRRFEKTTWLVKCQLENKGQYPVVANLLAVSMLQADDNLGLPLVIEGNSLKIQIPNWKSIMPEPSRKFEVPPGTAGREIKFIAKYEDRTYPTFLNRPNIIVKNVFEFQTTDAPVNYLRTKFPEASTMILALSKSAAPSIVLADVQP